MSVKERPIFVVGSGRSGTTLLQYMLRSHPQISSPTGESHFIIPLYRRAGEFGDLTRVENMRRMIDTMHSISREFMEEDLQGMIFDPDSLAREFVEAGADTIPKVVTALYEKNMRGEGKTRWLDKTPYYILNLDTILLLFPDAQIVHIIRDGRDCALSMLRRRHDLKIFSLYHAAKIWEQYVRAGMDHGRSLDAGTYYEIKYEDLLEDPENEMTKLCAFLKTEYDPGLVDFIRAGNDPRDRTPLLSKGIQKGNRDKWRTLMTPWQIRVVESAAGQTLLDCGYVLDTSPKPLPLPLRAAYRLHERIAAWHGSTFAKRPVLH